VRVSDAFDERIDYTLDAMGGRTLEQIHGPGGAALAKTQSRVFDALACCRASARRTRRRATPTTPSATSRRSPTRCRTSSASPSTRSTG